MKMPEMMKTMREMAMEMERAGLIEEMMDDAMESLDGEDIEDEVCSYLLPLGCIVHMLCIFHLSCYCCL